MNKRIRTGVALTTATAVFILALAGCSPKSGAGGGDSDEGADVKTGAGVSNDAIRLGYLAGMSGVYGATGADQIRGAEYYWETVNATGGICETYQVELMAFDTETDVQRTQNQYQQVTPDVAAYANIGGTPPQVAVLPMLEADPRLVISTSGVDSLIESDVMRVTTATYGRELENVASYMLGEDLIHDGDTVAAVYVGNDYGKGGLSGVKAFASRHDMSVIEFQVDPAVTDLTAQVTDALSQGATAFFVSGPPGQTASIASVLQSRNADVAIATNTPAYAASLIQTAAAPYLEEHLYGGSMATTFSSKAGAPIYEGALALDPDSEPTNYFLIGYGISAAMKSLLEAACANGDLTPEGIASVRPETVDTSGVLVPLDFTRAGEAPADASFIFRPDGSADGLLTLVQEEPYSAED